MKKIFNFWLLISIFVLVDAVYAMSESDINFLVATLSQDRNLNTILSGMIDLNELPTKLKKKVVSIGYKPGDLVPAKCVLRSFQSEKGVILILVPPAKDSASKDPQDWMRLGSFHPILFDTMEKWKTRNEASRKALVDKNIAELKNNSVRVRNFAAYTLGNLKDPRAVEPLIAALMDENPSVRSNAAMSLDKIDPDWTKTEAVKQSVPDFISALNYKNSASIRKSATFALGKIKDPRGVEPLIPALKDEDWSVRFSAAWALGNIKDPRAVEPLIAALNDEVGNVQANTASALGEIKDPRAVEPLIALLKDTNTDFIQKAVTKALGEITGRGFDGNYDSWNNWWNENKGSFMKE